MYTLDPPGPHVLFLNWRDTGNPEGGGSEVYVERIAAELVGRGYRVTMFCAGYPGARRTEIAPTGVRVVRRGGRHTVYLWAALTVIASWWGRGAVARSVGRPDLVVDVCNGLPFFAPLYARRPVLAVVHHVHCEQWPVVLPPWAARLGWWIESRLAVFVYRRCRYVTVSQATRDELATLGVDPARVSLVHNGTPVPVGEPVDRTPDPSLVVLCRLVPHKRVEIALRSVAALVPEFPALRLVVAGQGWWEPRLRELVAELGVADRVEFAGFVDESRKHALLASAWVALTPSLKEGWGLTIVEAGALGTPSVAFRAAGGVAEAVVDGETGLLADSEEDFVARVRDLLSAPAARAAMGAAARAHAARFTWEVSGARFAELVATATDRDPATARAGLPDLGAGAPAEPAPEPGIA